MIAQSSSIVADVATQEMSGRRVRFPLTTVFELCLSLIVGALFVRSTLTHLANPYFFLSSIHGYKLVGPTLAMALALVLPFLQLTIACCLLGRFFQPPAFGIAALLFATYSVAQGTALWRGLNVSCGCFGATDSSPVTLGTLVFVVILSLCCAAASWCSRYPHRHQYDVA